MPKREGGTTRSEIVTVRTDPKMKYALELAARRHRRTISSFVEWAVDRAFDEIETEHLLGRDRNTFRELISMVWDVDPPDRLLKLADHQPSLMTFEEEKIHKAIRETDWMNTDDSAGFSLVLLDKVRECWDQLLKVGEGKLDTKDLVDPDSKETN